MPAAVRLFNGVSLAEIAMKLHPNGPLQLYQGRTKPIPSPYQARTKPLLPRPLPFPNALFPRSLLALQIWWTIAGGYGVICALSIGWVRLLLKAGLRDYLIHNPNAKSTLRTIHKAEGEDDLKQD